MKITVITKLESLNLLGYCLLRKLQLVRIKNMDDQYCRDIFDSQVVKLSQGSIFNYAYNEDYIDDEILGLVITARCDIANSKAERYSYLPVIPINIWVKKDLIKILKRQQLNQLRGSINKEINQLTGGIDWLNILRTQRIIEILTQNHGKKSAHIINKIEKYQALKDGSDFQSIKNLFGKEILSIMKEIIENRNMEYFFIDKILDYGPCIVNLREISSVERDIANKISEGIDLANLTQQQIDKYRAINSSISSEGLVLILGSVKSPYIELIMQRFSDIFTRVGVENPKLGLLDETIKIF